MTFVSPAIIVLEIRDPEGQVFERVHTWNANALTPHDVADRCLDDLHLREGWQATDVRVYWPGEQHPHRFTIKPAAEWRVGREV